MNLRVLADELLVAWCASATVFDFTNHKNGWGWIMLGLTACNILFDATTDHGRR